MNLGNAKKGYMENDIQNVTVNSEVNELYTKIKELIESSKREVAVIVNSTMTMLYWEVGTYMNDYVLKNRRAEYGKQIVVSLSRQLQMEYGTNFSEKNLRRMMQFAERFCDQKNKNEEHIELMHLSESNIRVAEYLTILPNKQLLEHKLQLAVERAHQKWQENNSVKNNAPH